MQFHDVNVIAGNKDVKTMLGVAVDKDIPVLLVGETGCGKTTIIREQAIKNGVDWIRFNLTGETTVDEFVGRYELEGGQTIWRDGILLQAMKTGKWLVVDEINVALPEILFVLHSLLDDDKIVTVAAHNGETIKPHKDFRFFATMNPVDEYAGTKELNKAFQSRFPIILTMQYPTKAIESKVIAKKTGIDMASAVLMTDVAIALRKAKREGKIFYTCSTRDLMQWGMLKVYGLDFNDAFKVSVMNKAPNDIDNIKDIFENITKRYIELQSHIEEPMTIEYFESQFLKLNKERNDFEKDKTAVKQQITREIVDQLTKEGTDLNVAIAGMMA